MGWLSKVVGAVTGFIGVSWLWDKVTGWLTPDLPTQELGLNLEKKGSNQPLPIYYGSYAKAPIIKVLNITTDKAGGAKNEYAHYICIIGEGELSSIGTVYFNGISEDAIDDERYHIERFTGSDSQTYCETLGVEFNEWENTAKLSGIAYLYVRLKQNANVNWWQGEPKITVDINRGMIVTDIRNGSHVYSKNPALCLYDFLTNKRYGKGMSVDKLSTQSFINATYFTQTPRTYTEEKTVKQWVPGTLVGGYWMGGFFQESTITTEIIANTMSCNARLDTDKIPKDNIAILLKGMRGILPESNGKYHLSIEKDGSPVYEFTANNTVGAIVSSGTSQNERYNEVIIKFRNKLTGEMDEVVFPEDTALFEQWHSEDGGTPELRDNVLLGEFTINTIDNRAEALQMAHVIAHRSRQDIKAQWQGLPETLVVQAGDIVALDSKIDGWNAKPFRIEVARQNLETGEMSFQGVEHQNTIYPWSISEVNEDYVDTSFRLPSAILAPTGLAFKTLPTQNDYQAKLTWNDPNDALVRSHRLNLYLVSDNSLVFSEITEQNYINVPLLAVGEYRAELVAQNRLFNSAVALLLFTVETPLAPSKLLLTAHNFEIVVTPVLAVRNHFTEFELRMNTEDDFDASSIVGLAKIFQVALLLPDTMHYFWCRTVTPFGNSAYISNSIITTNNPDEILEFLGIDVEALDAIQEQTTEILEQIPQITSHLEGLDSTLESALEGINLVATKASDNQVDINEIANSITIESFATKEKDWEYVKSLLDKELAITDLVEHSVDFAIAQQTFTTDVTELVSKAEANTTLLAAHDESLALVSESLTSLANADEALAQRTETLETSHVGTEESLALVSESLTTLSNADTALANRTETLETKVNLTEGQTVTSVVQELARAQVSYCTISRDQNGNPITNSADCTNVGGVWVTDKPISELLYGAKVTNTAGDSISAIAYLQALEDENGQLKARAFFGIDSNGKKGMVIYNDNSGQYERIVMNMIVDDFVISASDGTPLFYLDTQTGDLVHKGAFYAEKIIGDIVDAHLFDLSEVTIDNAFQTSILSFSVTPEKFDRVLSLSSIAVEIAEGSDVSVTLWRSTTLVDATNVYGYHVGQKSYSGTLAANIPKNTNPSFSLKVQGDGVLAMIRAQKIVINLFSQGTSITVTS
ncbi:MAG: hypothetical protein JKY26_01670 [Pseudomonas sp.]|nr:hypothetical protein [Pseudomonas sp.]